MPETMTMSCRETEHLKVVSRIEAGELTIAEAADSIRISERQMYRILSRYRLQGEQGLILRLDGRSSISLTTSRSPAGQRPDG